MVSLLSYSLQLEISFSSIGQDTASEFVVKLYLNKKVLKFVEGQTNHKGMEQ